MCFYFVICCCAWGEGDDEAPICAVSIWYLPPFSSLDENYCFDCIVQTVEWFTFGFVSDLLLSLLLRLCCLDSVVCIQD